MPNCILIFCAVDAYLHCFSLRTNNVSASLSVYHVGQSSAFLLDLPTGENDNCFRCNVDGFHRYNLKQKKMDTYDDHIFL